MDKIVDVFSGRVDLDGLTKEIRYQVFWKTPKKLVAKVIKRKKGYHLTIYISATDFNKGVIR